MEPARACGRCCAGSNPADVAKHPHHGREVKHASVAVLTVSDSRTEESDRSGSLIRRGLTESGHAILDYRIVPDEPAQVRATLETWLADDRCDAVIVNGGTGVSSRDRTYEAVAGMLQQRLDGFGELFRMLSYEEIGSAAMLSRAVAGVVGRKVIFSLPGSSAAVTLALEKLILPEIGHVLAELRR